MKKIKFFILKNNSREYKLFIDEELKTVVAKFNKIPAMTLVLHESAALNFSTYYAEELKSLRGKAKCAPEDDFDIKYGIVLAITRLMEKWNEFIVKRLNEIIKKNTENIFDVTSYFSNLYEPLIQELDGGNNIELELKHEFTEIVKCS